MSGLEFHLAWSLWQYICVFLLFAATSAYVVTCKALKDPELGFGWKSKVVAVLGWFMVLNFAAFDVGARQADLNRSRFNAPVPVESIEKIESNRLTRQDIKNTMDTTEAYKAQ